MTLISKILGAGKGRTAKLAGAVAATLLLAPIPALGFTFLTAWSFNTMTVNAPAPVASSIDFATGTTLTVDMGQNGITTQAGPSGSAVNPGAISFFTAQRNISIGSSGENLDIASTYQTLLQGASMQSIVYFQQLTGANAGSRVNVVPNTFNSTGILNGHSYFGTGTPVDVNLGPGTYTVFVRLKYKKDRFGIWDNSAASLGSPHTFTISSAVGP
ncbi:MAG TPA: hypothetical protein VGP68_04090 [Gemmataceae bacterium]|jgi:hypothetical protein|nr:hypothetical protein [Gemmataceae bacterium]